MVCRKKVPHPDNSIYNYRYGMLLDNGAQEFIFEPTTGIPLYLFRGAGRTVAGLRAIPNAPSFMQRKRVTVAGLGGVQTGQYILQPLIDSLGGDNG